MVIVIDAGLFKERAGREPGPSENITSPIRPAKGEAPKYWDREYVNHKILSVANHQHKMLLQFLWMSGVRITEAIRLRKQDLDFHNSTMSVLQQNSDRYTRRMVPLHHQLRDLLALYTAAMGRDEKVFPITRQRAWQLTQKYLGGNPRQLRHSFAVNWLRSNGDRVVLHRILGHSTMQTMVDYSKIIPTDEGKELLKIRFD